MLAASASDNCKVSTNHNASVRLNGHGVYALQGVASADAVIGHRKGPVHRTVGVELSDRLARDTIDRYENATHEHLPICLHRQDQRHIRLKAGPRIETEIHRAIGVKLCDAIAIYAVDILEVASNYDSSIGMQPDGVHLGMHDQFFHTRSWIKGRIKRAVSIQSRNPTPTDAIE